MWNFQFYIFIDYIYVLHGMAKFPQLLSNRLLSNFDERLFQNPKFSTVIVQHVLDRPNP